MYLNELGMYDRIKEEIKGEIEICVPAKVISSSVDYAIVQPLPNIRTNANKFVNRKAIKVRTIGTAIPGDIGYLISGDVPTTDTNGDTFNRSPYDPSEGEKHKFSNGFFISINSSSNNVERFPVYEGAGDDLLLNYSIIGQGYHKNFTMPTSVFLPTTLSSTISFKNQIVPFVKTLDLDLSKYGIYIYFAFGYETTYNPSNCYCRLTSNPYFIITSSTNAGYLLGSFIRYNDPEINYSNFSNYYIGSPNYCSETLKPYHCAINVLTLDFSKYDFSDTSISGLTKIRVINHTDKTPYSMGYFGQNTIYKWIVDKEY
jgi:hypothetical protein